MIGCDGNTRRDSFSRIEKSGGTDYRARTWRPFVKVFMQCSDRIINGYCLPNPYSVPTRFSIYVRFQFRVMILLAVGNRAHAIDLISTSLIILEMGSLRGFLVFLRF